MLALLLLVFASYVLAQDQFTPVVVSALNPGTQVFLGTDHHKHIVYELMLTNASPTPATLDKLEVLDAGDQTRVLHTWQGKALLDVLRSTGNTAATSLEIPFDGTRLLLLELSLDSNAPVPTKLVHRLTLQGGSTPARTAATPAPMSYIVGPISVGTAVPVISPPLRGKGWVALNGCCQIAGAHRASSMPVNGGIHFAQRFAIDWMKMDDAGQLVRGDPDDVHSYGGYGEEVIAVADGTVVSTLNSLEDQKPGTLPDPKTMNLDNVDGNHVVIQIADGVYAFYAHLQKGSITVTLGDHVKRGQVLGKLGNTGNTSAPHLHFHLMNGPSVLGSSGIPYVIDSFAYDGEVPAAKFAEATSMEGDWGAGRLATPSPRKDEFPMDLAIINFGGQAGGAAGNGVRSRE